MMALGPRPTDLIPVKKHEADGFSFEPDRLMWHALNREQFVIEFAIEKSWQITI